MGKVRKTNEELCVNCRLLNIEDGFCHLFFVVCFKSLVKIASFAKNNNVYFKIIFGCFKKCFKISDLI